MSIFHPFAFLELYFADEPGGCGWFSVENVWGYGDEKILRSGQSDVGKPALFRDFGFVSYLKGQNSFDTAKKNNRPMLQPLCSVDGG